MYLLVEINLFPLGTVMSILVEADVSIWLDSTRFSLTLLKKRLSLVHFIYFLSVS